MDPLSRHSAKEFKSIVGSFVKFTSKASGDIFSGKVYFYCSATENFGIDGVSRTTVLGSRNMVEGCYQFSLNDIKNVSVIPAVPKSTTTDTEKDDQENNPGDASSSSTLLSKCVTDRKYQPATKREDVRGSLSYSINVSHSFNPIHEILQKLTSPDYMSSSMFLDEPQDVASILEKLLRSESNNDALSAFQIAFPLLDKGQDQSFLSSIIDRLVAPKVETRLIEAVQAAKTSFDQIPPEITSDIFFRIPKRYYPIVACVSKAFKNLVKSPGLLQQRRQLDKDSVYFCFNNGSPNPAESMTWFSLRKSNDNPNDDVFAQVVVVPNDHECTRTLRNIFCCGSEIILVGGTSKKIIGPECQNIDPTKVWIFDSICGRLREAPPLPLELHYRNSGLVRDDLYVFGTPLKAESLRERFQVYGIRFDLLSQTWSDPFPTKMQFSASTQSVDKNIYLLTWEQRHQVYNISNGAFTSYRAPYKSPAAWTTWTMSSVCVFENVFYSYDAVHGLDWYDTKLDKWNAVTGSTMGRIEHGLLGNTWSIALKEYYGKLVLLWTDRDYNPFSPEEIDEDARMTVYYTMIAIGRRTETEIYGEVDEIRTLGTLPRRYSLEHCVSVLV